MSALPNSVISIEALRAAEQNLALVRWLEGSSAHIGNEELAGLYLEAVGLTADRQTLRDRLDDLERLGLITIRYEKALRVVSLTARGGDVALGRLAVEGVRRPGPDCAY